MNERIQRKIRRLNKIYTAFLGLIAVGAFACLILGIIIIIDMKVATYAAMGLVFVYVLVDYFSDLHLDELRYSC